jgi:hypothetical protein
MMIMRHMPVIAECDRDRSITKLFFEELDVAYNSI